MEKEYIITITEEHEGFRLDHFLNDRFKDISRSYLKKLIDSGKILLNGIKVKAGSKVQIGDTITVSIPELDDSDIEPQDLPLDIVYEDNDVMLINKHKGMVVHPGHGNREGTLVNALLYQVEDLSGINGVKRPGIVHRIDKDTSGLLLVAKNDTAHRSLADQLKEHKISRNYMALVEGVIREDNGKIEAPIGRDPKNRIKMGVTQYNSKHAITHFKVIKRFRKHTLIEATLETGRTHQIRVHMAYIGHPLVGDKVYGFQKQNLFDKGQLLHAYKLTFTHPASKELMSFETELPEYFMKILRKLENQN
ncbi:RluA family pseudouridine synthase [Alkalibacter mobilis]|uniref:RluA family pseudouridine synthase n=1 Tax=Alkalibacter mobilis TaxID=2787712 RepID=UPI00189F2765|nr:RluA family pseudouridine synthase [Alkalibacter mobilis]MBF7095867.1 RluA family pseudouridine synthase [Alkalibacter mobilis]